jgi:hypothetical protein
MGEELERWSESTHPTGVTCADCEDEISYEEEFILIQVVQAQKVGNEIFLYPLLDETGLQSDFLFEPYHFCFKCWEDSYEKVQEEMEDTPPIADVLSVIECSCCGSGIREWEIIGTWTIGEFFVSRRFPAGGAQRLHPRFNGIGKPSVLCSYCIALLNEVVIAMWDDFPAGDTCLDCVQIRCWRTQDCACTCHEEGETE